jgi:hypothetical protein
MSVSQYGRVYSVVTQTPARIRRCLRVDDQTLVEQDISACQPLLLGMLSMQSFIGPGISVRERTGSSFHMMCVSAPISNHALAPRDLKDYVSTCENGEFYPALADTLEMKCGSNAERNAVKRKWCQLTYGATQESDPKWRAYADRFPAVANATQKLKAHDYRVAARTLQGIEADLMIHQVAQDIFLTRESSCILSVHDSILSVQDDADYVRDTIANKWGQYGATPRINSA